MPDPITLSLLAKMLAGGGAAAGSGIAPGQAGLAAIPELFKMGLGIHQAVKGKQLSKTERPQYEIPESMKRAKQTAQMLARDTRLPGQAAIESQIGASTSAGQRALKETGAGMAERMAGLAGLYTGQQQQMTNVGVQAAQQQQQDLMNLQNMLQNYAQHEQAKWQWDKQQPYLDAMAAAQREKDAANKNIYSATKGLAGAAASTIGTAQQPQTTQGSPATPSTGAANSPTINRMLEPQKASGGMDDAFKYWGMPQTPAQPNNEYVTRDEIQTLINQLNQMGGVPGYL